MRINRSRPITLYYDNKMVICIAHNPVQHDRIKHIKINRLFIKKVIESGLINTPYVHPSCDQLADVLTKGLPTARFHELKIKLGMEVIHSLA